MWWGTKKKKEKMETMEEYVVGRKIDPPSRGGGGSWEGAVECWEIGENKAEAETRGRWRRWTATE